MKRRDFIAGALAAAGALAHHSAATPEKDLLLAAAKGPDPAAAAGSAVAALGGIGRFVRPGMRVMLLPNPQGRLKGASTRPELVGAVARLCLEAGAAKVEICSIHERFRWSGTGIVEAAERAGAALWTPGPGDWREFAVPGARRQKKLRVIAPALEADLVINMPVAKQHESTRFTGALKNLMGVNEGNAGWHQGPAYLVDSIVDLASVVRPRLAVVDATEMLAENGPFGPGRTVKPGLVVAGTDPVAIDAFTCGLLGLKPGEVSTIVRAAERGLGALNLVSAGEEGGVSGYRGA
ncbi:MAG: hypothetical protein A3F83_12385 [Candidatus Glassbacteria bacterium RIFCSPLOWO2_12_FULL_58_11]|uniref:DUF362 domain-containing protein n=2 Tax=Candidatus Glassiibacteriota TaxID=1817805 RepID=A0A1F5YQ27_9BACT|nr:MAG: hypothetical protein A2Z86_01390 [Candidatus Glassbacteria bacterium GWA2_58_10]OGG02173.1 MAG: hypothetical protein A3F83_12385 [Candidatus Glassbacteria bacterium RIFCSPLOWO2_12_FULL_58_11]